MNVHDMQAFRYWFKVPGQPVYVCLPPKCGSESMRRCLYGQPGYWHALSYCEDHQIGGPYSPWEVAALPGRKLLGIRSPHDRFLSLWYDRCAGPEPRKNYGFLHGLSPSALLDLIERQPFGDTHWFPQSFYRVPDVELVIYSKIYAELGVMPSETPHENASDRSEPPPIFDAHRIYQLYGQDYGIWLRIKTNGG